MKDILGILTVSGIVIAFFYYGYRHDYRRNPKEFKRTIIGVPLGILSFMNGIPFVSELVRKWINEDEKDI
jgi:hypothetical protein